MQRGNASMIMGASSWRDQFMEAFTISAGENARQTHIVYLSKMLYKLSSQDSFNLSSVNTFLLTTCLFFSIFYSGDGKSRTTSL